MTEADLASLYRQMLRCRRFEEAVAELWQDGLIAGEMHLGTGEEAIIAGVLDHLRDGDALALDHRGTAALLLRGVDPLALLREFLGRPDGLCGGRPGAREKAQSTEDEPHDEEVAEKHLCRDCT